MPGIQTPGRPLPALTRAAIATDALRYKGKGYTYGGDCSGGAGDWDCSSFVSWVLGRDLRMSLPGGGKWGDPGYPPNDHGPVVLDYARWDAATTVATPARGDLVVWPGSGPNGHIGIVLGPNQMISALNPTLGTLVSPIDGYGPPGVPHIYRSVTGAAGGQPTRGQPPPEAQGILPALLTALVVTGAAVVGAGILVAVAWPLITGGITFGVAALIRRTSSDSS